MELNDLPKEIFKYKILPYFRGNYCELNELLCPISEKDYGTLMLISDTSNMETREIWINYLEKKFGDNFMDYVKYLICINNPSYLFLNPRRCIIFDFYYNVMYPNNRSRIKPRPSLSRTDHTKGNMRCAKYSQKGVIPLVQLIEQSIEKMNDIVCYFSIKVEYNDTISI